VQIHGAVMTLWCIGFIVQTWLIEAAVSGCTSVWAYL
jgi:hypothetical protein